MVYGYQCIPNNSKSLPATHSNRFQCNNTRSQRSPGNRISATLCIALLSSFFPLFFYPSRFSSEQATLSLHVDSFLCASRGVVYRAHVYTIPPKRSSHTEKSVIGLPSGSQCKFAHALAVIRRWSTRLHVYTRKKAATRFRVSVSSRRILGKMSPMDTIRVFVTVIALLNYFFA